MKQIKYTYISRNAVRRIFWIGGVLGALIFGIFGGLHAAIPEHLWYGGIKDAGLAILSGTIAFCGGMLVKLKQ